MGKRSAAKTGLFPYFMVSMVLFALFVPLGTLVHELFHLFSALVLGCKAILLKSSIDYSNCTQLTGNCKAIGEDSICYNDFLIYLAGPLGTLIISLTGLVLLKCLSKTSFLENLWVVLSLFHLRVTANAGIGLLSGDYELSTDERIISSYLGVNQTVATILVHTISLFILLSLFQTLGFKRSLFYFFSGLAGFIAGYFLFF